MLGGGTKRSRTSVKQALGLWSWEGVCRRHRKKGVPGATARFAWGKRWNRHLFPDTHTRPQATPKPPTARIMHSPALPRPLTLRAGANLRHGPPHGGHRGDGRRWVFSLDSCTCHCAAQAEDRAVPSECSAAARAPPPTQGSAAAGRGPARLQQLGETEVAAAAELVGLSLQRRRGRLGGGGAQALVPGEGSPGRALIRSGSSAASRAREGPGETGEPLLRPAPFGPYHFCGEALSSVPFSPGYLCAPQLWLIHSFPNCFLTLKS